MNKSNAFYAWLTQAHSAATAEDQQRILAKARTELAASEYQALLRVLRDTRLLFN